MASQGRGLALDIGVALESRAGTSRRAQPADAPRLDHHHLLNRNLRSLLVSLSAFLVIGATSSLTYNVASHLKTALIMAGGVVLFGVAHEMVKAQKSSTRSTQGEIEEEYADVGIVPMGMPLLGVSLRFSLIVCLGFLPIPHP